MRMRRTTVAAGAVLLLLAACGGDDGATDEAGAPTDPAATSPADGADAGDDAPAQAGATDVPVDASCDLIDDAVVEQALGAPPSDQADVSPGEAYPEAFRAPGAPAEAQARECLYAGDGVAEAFVTLRPADPALFEGLRTAQSPDCPPQQDGVLGPESTMQVCADSTPARVVHRVLLPSSIVTCGLRAAEPAEALEPRAEEFCSAAMEQLGG
jgi:hypothetical protein